MKLPKSIARLIEQFEGLPGIGPKTSQRLVFHLLRMPAEDVKRFADTLGQLKEGVRLCSVCRNVSESDMCSVCDDPNRNKKKILVVSGSLDTFAVERTGFDGVYHVLHGVIDPLNNIGPDELFIADLVKRLRAIEEGGEIPVEVILATNTTMEGEATALYINKVLQDAGLSQKVRVTRIARGLPVGGDIEYTDDITLGRALEGRLDF